MFGFFPSWDPIRRLLNNIMEPGSALYHRLNHNMKEKIWNASISRGSFPMLQRNWFEAIKKFARYLLSTCILFLFWNWLSGTVFVRPFENLSLLLKCYLIFSGILRVYQQSWNWKLSYMYIFIDKSILQSVYKLIK